MVFRLDRENPYLALGHVTIFVRDQERSLSFYRDRLGFSVAQIQLDSTVRFVAVAPPDGTAALTLIAPPIGSSDYGYIGRSKGVVLMSEDVDAQYQRWRSKVFASARRRKPRRGAVS
jgi:Glyoxalase/Bleomycin resistance protein/Dioxygenase superfamily